ncbi:MAG: hypothetical protein GY795_24405 [Desulfobacterales bacterium]|nr:hypothetical protein [Desulfobacterales bacterium]
MTIQSYIPCPFGANTKIVVTVQTSNSTSNNISSTGEGSTAGTSATSNIGSTQSSSSSSYGSCLLASSIPTRGSSSSIFDTFGIIKKERLNALKAIRQKSLKSMEAVLEDRQYHLKTEGCPKWRMRIEGGTFRRIVCAECKYADGRRHSM